MEDLILTEDVWKIYKMGKVEYPALRGVSLRVRRGEFAAIVGPSGSGKSTMLHLIGALDRPTKGKIYLEGTDLSKLNDDQLAMIRRRKIGFIFQTFNLIPRLNALQNVEIPMMADGVPRDKRIKRALELLKIVGLEGLEDHRPSELSGGERQRVAIARALANQPSIILADEPTGNLDSESAWSVMRVLKKLNVERSVTVVLVTHNIELTKVCDRIFYLRDGKIIKEEVMKGD